MKPNVFLRNKGLNCHFRLKGSEFNGNLLDLLNDYKEATTKQLPIQVVVSSFLCEGCGSDNIKERSGYKVCFDCGKGH